MTVSFSKGSRRPGAELCQKAVLVNDQKITASFWDDSNHRNEHLAYSRLTRYLLFQKFRKLDESNPQCLADFVQL